MSSNCLVFHTSGGISSSPVAFLFLIFPRTESSSSWVNGPSLMSNCLLIVLVIGSCVTFGGFPQFYSFLLVCSFQFRFRCALPSTHFVYCLPGNPRLPIFHWVSNLIYLILYVFCLFLYICLLIDIVPFLVFGHLCLLGSFDSLLGLF